MSTWATALDGFGEHLADTGRSTATAAGYCKHVGWLAESAPAGPWELSSRELLTWLDGQRWSAETRRKVVVSIRTFYAWAVADGRLEWAPTAGIPAGTRCAPGPRARPLPEPWAVPVEEWVATLRACSRSEGTISQYLVRIRMLSRLATSPWSITGQQLAAWLSNPDWSPQTKRSSGVAVTGFYRWAVKVGRIERSPADDLGTVRVPRSLPRPVPEDVLHAALATADDRTRLAIMLAAYAGLRIGEIATLHTSQVTETQLMVVGKGGHHRIIPLAPDGDLVAELRAEMARRRRGTHGSGWQGRFVSATGYLFPSSDHPGPITANALGRTISSVFPGDWATHALRHRFATAAYATERDLMAVQQLLGHSRPETTSVYAQVPDGALLAAVVGAGAPRW